MFKRLNISKWLGALFAPIEKNGAFFVFMFALGYLCTQLEIMPYYLRAVSGYLYRLRPIDTDSQEDPYLCKVSALCDSLWSGHRRYVLL